MANQFIDNRATKILGHTLKWSTRFFWKFSNTNDVKKHAFFVRRNTTYEMKTCFCTFSPIVNQRRAQTCMLAPLRFSDKCFTSYDVMSAAPTLSVKMLIIEKKSYLLAKIVTIRLLFSRFRGLIIFLIRIRRLTWPLFCILKVIEKIYAVITKNSFKEKSLLSDRKHVCTIFLVSVELASLVFTKSFLFL